MLGAWNFQFLIDEAYSQAIKILKECVSPIGFKASALADGYHEVWGRDSMITMLGALETDEPDLIQASRASLATLKKYQTKLGLIPNNVDVESDEAEYRAYMDGTIWYLLGVYSYFKKTKDQAFFDSHSASVELAFSWLAHQDVDNSGLISTQEAGDWMDLFPVRGKVLYDNALYHGALSAAGRESNVADLIKEQLWVHESHENMLSILKKTEDSIKNNRRLEEEKIRLAQNSVNLIWRPYFLAFRGFRQYGDWFDSLGNYLAILFEVATDEQSGMILDFLQQTGIDQPHPSKATYPPIYPGEKEWHDYFKVGNLNLPHHYHNGGIWPFVGGFYVAALVKAGRQEDAQRALENLAAANYKGKKFKWEFNEWLHGITGNPMGKEKQAWSAAMYIFAYQCVKRNKVELF